MNTYYYRDEDKPRVDIFSHKASDNMVEMRVGLVFVEPIAVTFGITAQSSWAGRGTAHVGFMGVNILLWHRQVQARKRYLFMDILKKMV